MATCDKCMGRAFYDNECRDCGYEKDEKTVVNEVNVAVESHGRSLGGKLHPEINRPPKISSDPPQGEFPFLRR